MSKRKINMQSVNAIKRNGLKAYENGNFQKAIEMWLRLPEEFRPLSALAEVHFRLGLEENAKEEPYPSVILDYFKKAVEYQPKNPKYLYHLGLVDHHLGDFEDAIKIYKCVLAEESPFSERAAYQLALALLKENRPLESGVLDKLQAKEKAILHNISAFNRRPYKLSPEAPLVWHALILFDDENFEQAETSLNEVLSSGSSPIEKGLAHYYLGLIDIQADDLDSAREKLDKAYSAGVRTEQLESNLGELFHQEAENLLSTDSPKDALTAAKKAQRHKKDDNSLNKLVAQIHQHLGYRAATANKWDEALSHWKSAIDIVGSGFRLAYNLALVYEKKGEYSSAAESWHEVLRRRPRKSDHPDAINDEQVALLWQRTGEAYRNAGQSDEMIKVFKKAIERDKDNYELQISLSKEYLAEGRFQAAENELERILKRKKNYIPALMLMGEVLFNNEKWWIRNSAPPYWEKILKQDPEHLQARQALGDYYRNQADIDYSWDCFEDAVDNFQKALEYQPNDARTLAYIANCYIQDRNIENAEIYIDQAFKLAPKNKLVIHEIIGAWILAKEFKRAWILKEDAEERIDESQSRLYLLHAEHLLEIEENEEASRWVDSAVENAPPDEPILIMAGEMAMDYDDDFAAHYLEKALEVKKHEGQAHLLLGVLADKRDKQRERNRHWRQAESIARQTKDEELKEGIEFARFTSGGPSAMMERIMNMGGPEAMEDFFAFMDGEFDE